MNKFKTITALLLTGILTLSLLTACGNSTSSDHADRSTAGPSQIVSSAQGGQQSSPEETSDGLVVTTAGKVQGTLNDGVYTYLGVPYAHATERFVPAQAVEPWEGVFQADTYGNISPQGAMFGMPGQAQPGTDNNCQNLNQGYQGGNLSRSGDVVVVTVNHRLNLFGHLNLSAYGEKYERSANVGITDIVAALEWIQDNIAAFGGDPDNVTVFGQSGGGAKVLALMTSPYAQGLFHKGIVQSGAIETVGVNFTSQEASTRLTENFLSILNISEDNIETLQTISEDELQSAGTQALQMTADEFQIPAALGEGYSMEWEPVVDGDFLPSHPVTEESFASAGADIPLLIGSNLNEWNFFPAQEQGEQVSQELTDAVRAAYPGKTELTAGQVDTLIRLPMLKIMSHKADQNGAPVYAYLFTYGMSFHGAEIPYVFRNTEDTLEEQAMADQLSQVWVSFARTGIPGGDGIPAWEPYTRESGATMLLDTQAELVYHHDRELMNLMAPDYVY